ncbi:hypothetical protein AOLI_G00323980 [Acnodon oligacanthus]
MVATGCRISSQYLSALRLPPMKTSLVFPVREMPPHIITLPPTKDVTLSVQRSPRLLHTLSLRSNCRRQNLDSSLNITFLHMFRLQCTCCRHQCTGLMVKGSHGRPPGSPMPDEIGCVQSVLECLGREPSAISSCRP